MSESVDQLTNDSGVYRAATGQTWKMSETLSEQDCSFPDFTQQCVKYVNFKIATKQRNLSANTMFTTFRRVTDR